MSQTITPVSFKPFSSLNGKLQHRREQAQASSVLVLFVADVFLLAPGRDFEVMQTRLVGVFVDAGYDKVMAVGLIVIIQSASV